MEAARSLIKPVVDQALCKGMEKLFVAVLDKSDKFVSKLCDVFEAKGEKLHKKFCDMLDAEDINGNTRFDNLFEPDQFKKLIEIVIF